jgi:hypothetical protein
MTKRLTRRISFIIWGLRIALLSGAVFLWWAHSYYWILCVAGLVYAGVAGFAESAVVDKPHKLHPHLTHLLAAYLVIISIWGARIPGGIPQVHMVQMKLDTSRLQRGAVTQDKDFLKKASSGRDLEWIWLGEVANGTEDFKVQSKKWLEDENLENDCKITATTILSYLGEIHSGGNSYLDKAFYFEMSGFGGRTLAVARVANEYSDETPIFLTNDPMFKEVIEEMKGGLTWSNGLGARMPKGTTVELLSQEMPTVQYWIKLKNRYGTFNIGCTPMRQITTTGSKSLVGPLIADLQIDFVPNYIWLSLETEEGRRVGRWAESLKGYLLRDLQNKETTFFEQTS